jgi:prolyl oligopeptidase
MSNVRVFASVDVSGGKDSDNHPKAVTLELSLPLVLDALAAYQGGTHADAQRTYSQLQALIQGDGNTPDESTTPTVVPVPQTKEPVDGDEFRWLEEVEGADALAWVKQANAATVMTLETQPVFKAMHQELRHLYTAKDRVPWGSFHAGHFYNFWRDAIHERGLWRRCTYEEYRKTNPAWEILLDVDQVSREEDQKWVHKGHRCLGSTSLRYLVKLSPGGSDACTVREFDVATKAFLSANDPRAFHVPHVAKTFVVPLDEDTVLIGTDWGTPDALTTSGYPRQVKRWVRGQSLAAAELVFEAQITDVSAGASVTEERGSDGILRKHTMYARAIDFYESEAWIQMDGSSQLRKLPKPLTADVQSIQYGRLVLQLKRSHTTSTGRVLPANSILVSDLQADTLDDAQVVYTASATQSIQGVQVSEYGIYVTMLDNILSRVVLLRRPSSDKKKKKTGAWTSVTLPFPDTGILELGLADELDCTDFDTVFYSDHLTPYSQYRVHHLDHASAFRMELLKTGPVRFDASTMQVTQRWATSRDGTRVPYFLLARRNLVLDGSHPTILYGYGGFESALTPSYESITGKVWLERGGVYAIANTRGGDEFGSAWHQAGLKENRQKIFDDFIAVAEHLVSTKVTQPAHLGISGGSNGGLLVGACMIQRPDMFGAALASVPLLDMLRYTQLLAGASWIGEYGDPSKPEEAAYLRAYSPYHNIKPHSTAYPQPFFTTSTKDDRVHPGHARKMVARLRAAGHACLYYENIEGGHAGAATPEQNAYMAALEHVYFAMRLGLATLA